mgnify:CR=1 FL=1
MTDVFHLQWRPLAREDLRGIVRYIGRDDPERARTFGQELRNRVERLARHPKSGRPARPGLPKEVRELVVPPNYVVFYRTLPEARVVEILRVRHAAQQTP